MPDARGPLPLVRRSIARVLRSKVAGDDADAKARDIWGDDGERWFSSADPIWRVNSDAAMYPGGIRALLLQSLHPLAMAGVAGHSGYKSDPWGRLQRTANFIAMTTFGPVPAAEAAIAHVRSIHERVRGKADDGTPYRASDPHLLAWVGIAETASFLASYRAFGDAPLSDADADTYVAQSALVAEKLGAADMPRSVAELDARLASYRPELRATGAAKEAARFLLLEPPIPRAARPGYGMLAAGAVATLPDWAREMLDLPTLPTLDRFVGRPLGRAGAGVIRWAMSDPSLADTRRSNTGS